nr:phage tail sheath C-terminal domain-containing protein [uncultured Rhodopila sp.]
MPVLATYPGVYIQELPSGVRSIVGVSTSLTAFIGRALRGPLNTPTAVNSYADFNRIFGGLWATSALGYSVAQFFSNGGSQALIVRVYNGTGGAATATLANGGTGIVLAAANPGVWGSKLTAAVTAVSPASTTTFNLTLTDSGGAGGTTTETYFNLSVDPASPKFVGQVLAQQSQLAVTTTTFSSSSLLAIPTAQSVPFTGGGDGSDIGDAQVSGSGLASLHQGLWALDKAPIFNLLVIPPYARPPSTATYDVGEATWNAAVGYAQSRRAFVIIDPPSSWTPSAAAADALSMETSVLGGSQYSSYAAIYYPYLLAPDPLINNLLASFAPSGTLAGIYAYTDAQRGVWKAPAGIDATLSGAVGLTTSGATTPVTVTDSDSAALNPLGVNCLRSFPVIGNVVWGARTMAGADALESQWKYIPIRRLANYIEQSLFQGTQWVVFEPNAEPLWAQIRLDVGAFMQTLFVQGAFQGTTPSQAYFVNCDSTTTTQTDIENGIVNIVVGFAPLYPAEFVIISIQQISPS